MISRRILLTTCATLLSLSSFREAHTMGLAELNAAYKTLYPFLIGIHLAHNSARALPQLIPYAGPLLACGQPSRPLAMYSTEKAAAELVLGGMGLLIGAWLQSTATTGFKAQLPTTLAHLVSGYLITSSWNNVSFKKEARVASHDETVTPEFSLWMEPGVPMKLAAAGLLLYNYQPQFLAK